LQRQLRTTAAARTTALPRTPRKDRIVSHMAQTRAIFNWCNSNIDFND
jgi:hypothetical protein